MTKTNPTGTTLVRLADVPLKDRLHALNQIMQNETLTEEQAQNYLALVIDPGDTSARIAA